MLTIEPQTYRFTWQGIGIEAVYPPRYHGIVAHLEIRSTSPEGAPLPEWYVGSYANLAHYVQEVTEDTTTIPPILSYYIDWHAMARDAEISGDLFTIETGYGEVHVFATNGR